MPFDPVRDAIAVGSPTAASPPMPLPRQPHMNGSSHSNGVRPPERRANSLAHILASDPDDAPWSSRSAPVVAPSPTTPFHDDHPYSRIMQPTPASAPYSYRPPPTDSHPITLPPAEHRYPYREAPPSPQSIRERMSPVDTRTSSPVRGRSPEDILSFPHRPSRRPSLSPLAAREAEEILNSYPHRPSRSPISHRGTPLTLSPVQTFRSIDDRPTTSQQPVIAPLMPSPPQRHASPPPPMPTAPPLPEVRKPIPYNPKRKTPADSVLRPLTPSEEQSYRHPRNPLRVHNRSPENISVTLPPSDDRRKSAKRRRDLEDDPSAPKRSRDAGLVAQHYNARPNVDVNQRRESPIIGLKSFNNWIKSVIIAKWAAPIFIGDGMDAGARRNNRPKGRVLDMGCGKGGDLQKWQKSRIQYYCGLDVAETSISQARDRASQLRSVSGFNVDFHTLDCYAQSVETVLNDDELRQNPFDIVSMQFCMHYAFENISKVKLMLANVTRYLRVGGRFIGTVPNANFLQERLDALPPDATDLSFGNSVFKITFENRQFSLYGQRYRFFLLDAVDDVPEYVVHWDSFVSLAREYGLHLLEGKEFHDIYMEEREHPNFGPLLKKMRVVDEQGSSQMDEDQWDAANIYIGFAFEKRLL